MAYKGGMMYIQETCPCGTQIVLEGVYEQQAIKTLKEFRSHHTGCLNNNDDYSQINSPQWWTTYLDNKTESH